LRTRSLLIHDDLHGPAGDDDLIPWIDGGRLYDLAAVEIGAVGRAEILDLKAVADSTDLAVHAGDAGGLKA
jgi:hypothetical protein